MYVEESLLSLSYANDLCTPSFLIYCRRSLVWWECVAMCLWFGDLQLKLAKVLVLSLCGLFSSFCVVWSHVSSVLGNEATSLQELYKPHRYRV